MSEVDGEILSFTNIDFIIQYEEVLQHHLKCILNHPLSLYEDKNTLKTFWNDMVLVNQKTFHNNEKFYYYCGILSACIVISGILGKKYTALEYGCIAASLAVPVYKKINIKYFSRRYKLNFEELTCSMLDVYLLICRIRELFYEFVLSEKFYDGPKFLKFAVQKFEACLIEIKSGLINICKLVPLSNIVSTHGEFRENLFELNITNESRIPTCSEYHKLLGDYILFTSNILNRIGLCFCTNLWEDGSCNLKKVFDDIIPEILEFFKKTVKEIRTEYDNSHKMISLTQNFPTVKSDEILEKLNSSDFYLSSVFYTNSGKETAEILKQPYCSLTEYINFLKSKKHKITAREASYIACNTSSNEIYFKDILALKIVPDIVQNSGNGISNLNRDRCVTAPALIENVEANNVIDENNKKLVSRCLSEEACLGDSAFVQPPQNLLEPDPNYNQNAESSKHYKEFMKQYHDSLNFLNAENQFHFGFNMYPDMPRPFNTTYSCYSVAMLPGNERQDVERGGKIIMPPSALEQLTRLNINYPMLFKITNKKTSRITHCGVLEFVADEGKVYLPLWMMQNLVLEEGNLIQIESVSLPVGTFAKFQPLNPDFLDISNPKAVLENCLRTFACLTAGDVVAVTYNQKVYELNVMETKPGTAISIIECDMNVEFAAPVGYKEQERPKPKEEHVIVDPAELMPPAAGFVPFRGDGNRLDGKPRKDSASSSSPFVKPTYVKGIPDYDWEFGTLNFTRYIIKEEEKKDTVEDFRPFHGTGHSLR